MKVFSLIFLTLFSFKATCKIARNPFYFSQSKCKPNIIFKGVGKINKNLKKFALIDIDTKTKIVKSRTKIHNFCIQEILDDSIIVRDKNQNEYCFTTKIPST